MVLIIVLMHAVAADQGQVRSRLGQLFADDADIPGIMLVVDRVSFRHSKNRFVQKALALEQAQLAQLKSGKFQ